MKLAFVLFSLWFLILSNNHSFAKEEEIVEKWASRLGKELWELGLSVTRVSDIKQSYKNLNARVLPTDGEGILHNIVSNVNRLLKQKMDSVMCLIEGAERLSEQFEDDNSTYIYFSSKYSNTKEDEEDLKGVNLSFYKVMDLGPDHHFYDINVNTSFSAVHVPTDVYDQGENVLQSLKWSEALDETFITNYQADPTMSWQYFGSATGFLRHYPALEWVKSSEKADMFDCRTRFWYIEAATCTKDILILVDTSGSMHGVKNTIASLTVHTLLDTFSNNDFINIIRFNKTMKAIVPCFPTDMLVQATPENIQLFKNSLLEFMRLKIKPEETANFRQTLTAGFELLTKYREGKNCTDDICNQALILITDTAPDNITDIFEKYNWFDNRTRIPVRLFTYLIGREVSNEQELIKMSCMNRGYFGHIKSLEEVRSEVLKYLSVIARPMVLWLEHPLSWTHSFVDATGGLDPHVTAEGYRFMTSVSGPAFDKRPKRRGNETILPELLGVAGTDVLISDIKSLTLPYKIGANGYAFVITNNGYLLFHPDLRPVYQGINETRVNENYNSVDLTEVELLDDNTTEPRKPNSEILKLREIMVNGTEGSIHGLKIKFHYDNMRRVGVETRNYFFAPLNNTPFTMGLVLPHSYGNFWIKAGDEIMKSKQMGIPITNYFKGNWKVHPEWVYCDYHRTSDRWFNSSEEKLLHFLNKISSPDWKWKERFPPEDPFSNDDDSSDKCNKPSIDETEYYCDKELMQLLVFDAKITEVSYKTSKWAAKDRRETELVKRFGASLRFLATQSGLTRWQYIPEPIEDTLSFGDTNNRALEEVWYRSAVLHHQLNPEAFVFSVPFDEGYSDDLKVTASHAIFPKDGGHEAPGSVVGFQIDHTALYRRFMDITSKPVNCENCSSCSSDSIDCYLIDGNGYIVLSEVKNDTGRFFGEIEGAIMEAMISKNIFRHVTMFDYQSICITIIPAKALANYLLTPFRYFMFFVEWIIGKALWLIIETELHKFVFAEEDYYDEEDHAYKHSKVIPTSSPTIVFEKPKEPTILYDACDKQGNLYLLQHLSREGYHYHSSEPVNCSRPFHVKRLPHTNLLLIVVNVLHQSCYRKLSANMEKIEYPDHKFSSCQKLNLNTLPRRRLSGCFNTHPMEEQFYQCSHGNLIGPEFIFIVIITVYYTLKTVSYSNYVSLR